MSGKFYFFTGNEDYSIKEATNGFVADLCKQSDDFRENLKIIRGDDDAQKSGEILENVMSEVNSQSLFSAGNYVWLKHFNKFEDAAKETTAKKKVPTPLERFAQMLKDGLPDGVTLIVDGPIDKRKAFYKACDKLKDGKNFCVNWYEKLDLKSKNSQGIIISRIREMVERASCGKKVIDQDAAAYLATASNGDIPRMANEIDKLLAYIKDAPSITLNDCYDVCTCTSETLGYEFSSALLEKDAAKALRLIPNIIKTMQQEKGGGSRPELMLIATASNEFQRLLAVKCEGIQLGIPESADSNYFYRLADMKDESNAGNPLLALHPFRAYKLWQNAVRFSDKDLANAFQYILMAGKRMISGGNPRIELEQLVLKITK